MSEPSEWAMAAAEEIVAEGTAVVDDYMAPIVAVVAPIIERLSDQIRNEALEEAAGMAEARWRNAPNTREDGFEANRLSHGCKAAAAAIRALKG